jgi:hypothetical protein
MSGVPSMYELPIGSVHWGGVPLEVHVLVLL